MKRASEEDWGRKARFRRANAPLRLFDAVMPSEYLINYRLQLASRIPLPPR